MKLVYKLQTLIKLDFLMIMNINEGVAFQLVMMLFVPHKRDDSVRCDH
jgi:hypothetical protein